MVTMFKGRDGKPTPKAPGRYQTGSAPPAPKQMPKTVEQAIAAGWTSLQIRQALINGSQGGHLRKT